jgi:hypothetical protein
MQVKIASIFSGHTGWTRKSIVLITPGISRPSLAGGAEMPAGNFVVAFEDLARFLLILR